MTRIQQNVLILASFLIVAFGQPAWIWWCGLIAAAVGYAIFWRVLLCYPSWKTRFFMSAGWFTAVQLVQLSWFLSHPYYYIYSVYILLSVLLGIQFGIIGVFITPKRMVRLSSIIAISALWTLFEWGRLFFFSGFSWNPVGLALAGSIYSLQMASLAGVFGLSFWTMVINMLFLRLCIIGKSLRNTLIWGTAALMPYLFGVVHLSIHDRAMAEQSTHLKAVLMQTSFPLEEALGITGSHAMIAYASNEWEQILRMAKKHENQKIDLMVFPELVVPYAAYSCIYQHKLVKAAFKEVFGEDSIAKLPLPKPPYGLDLVNAKGEPCCYVNNAFWAQGLANHFQTGVLIGLEDVDPMPDGRYQLYSAALYFLPQSEEEKIAPFATSRYEKRVLVPMGEYIPFECCRAMAASYGVYGSFTCGQKAQVFMADQIPFGVSICYDETFGHLMRDNKQDGAAVLANLTNDGWYPTLPWQHFEHARLRTVENGFALIRACNTGITGAIDSLGRNIAVLKEDNADSMHVHVPIYTYHTLYGWIGDAFIIGFSLFAILLFFKR